MCQHILCAATGVYSCLLDLVKATCSEGYNDVKACEGRINSLCRKVSALKKKKEAIDEEIKDAEWKGKVPIKGAKDWVQDVGALEEEVTSLKIEYDNRSRCLCDCAPNVFHIYKLSKKANEKLDKVKHLNKKGHFNEVATEPTPGRILERPGGIGLGMEPVLEQLQSYVSNGNVSIIGVCGMGRVGKSTILQKFHNELIPDDKEVVIYIDLAEQLSIYMIQRMIIDMSRLDWQENVTSNQRAAYILKQLKKRNFLLILDNVWEPLDLGEVGIPDLKDNKKGKVILSTRFAEVCTQMGAKIVPVKCLKWQDAWSIFKENAGETAQSIMSTDSRIQKQAEKLIRRCNGLPEALIYLGSAVASTESPDEWQHVIEEMDTRPWKIKNMEQVLSSLKQSYDKLDDKLQKCLLYCSLYPAGFSIEKEWIIDYCIGEGLFRNYNEGAHRLGELKAASLLERGDDEDKIRMHPLIHAMALWIACEYGKRENRWLVRPKFELKEAPRVDLWAEAQRISLMRNKISTLPACPNCPELETLMLQLNRPLKHIPNGFFQSMPILKVLDLSHTSIEKLPAGIAGLVSLQYLDVCGTKIKSLPIQLGELVRLRFLLLAFTPIETIPEGVIAKLSELQVLYIHASYGDWKVASDETGVGIEVLHDLKQLMALGITVKSIYALRKLAKSYWLARSTRYLEIRGCKGLTSISNTFLGDDMKDLQWLGITNTNDLKEVIIDRNECYLQKLRHLQLLGLQNVRIIWNQGCFQNLSYLVIYKCDRMESLVHWNNEVSEGRTMEPLDAFPYLKILDLLDLTELKSLCRGRKLALPSMQCLRVRDCPKLIQLAMVADKLQKICGGEQWWSRLEWDDGYVKPEFECLYK